MSVRLSRSIASLTLATVGVVAFGGTVVSAAPLLQVDVNDRSPDSTGDTDSNTQPGFLSYLLGPAGGTAGVTSSTGVTQNLGGYSVTLATANGGPLGTFGTGAIDDRDRDFSFDSNTLTLFEVYDDFVFQSQPTGGIRLTVGGGQLAANTPYNISIFSYDHGTPRLATASYVDLNNNDALVLSTEFVGGQVPTDESNKYTGVATTDASGFLSLRGFSTSTDSAGKPR